MHFLGVWGSQNSRQLNFLWGGTSKWAKLVVPSKSLDGKLFKNAAAWQILKFLTGTYTSHRDSKGWLLLCHFLAALLPLLFIEQEIAA